MGTKRYCDVCGTEADLAQSIENKIKAKDPSLGKDCFFTVMVSFGFSGHESGFGGPPDLCLSCQRKFIEALISAKNLPKGETPE